MHKFRLLYNMKKKKKKSSFPLIKPQIKRRLVIFWVLKLISYFDHISKMDTRNINNLVTFKEKNSVLMALIQVQITQQTDTKIINP